MVTLHDVARQAGVSVMTASNALRGKSIVRPATAQRVLAAAAELGYQPNLAARQLRRSETHVIGMTIVDFDLIFPTDLAAQVSDIANGRGYQTIVQQTRYSKEYERRVLSNVSAQICDGMIICWPHIDTEDLGDFPRKLPIVSFDGFKLHNRIDCVFTPSEEGSAAAIGQLAANGCRRILLLGCDGIPSDGKELTTSRLLRARGAANALDKLGLPSDQTMTQPCEWTRKSGYETLSQLIETSPIPFPQRFDGVFCLCDPIAIGALKAFADHGIRVPRDVAVIGFDCTEDGEYTIPGLSSIAIDPHEVAESCLDLLIERIDHIHACNGDSPDADEELPVRTRTVPYRIVCRGSAER